jgi:hypothetical protein
LKLGDRRDQNINFLGFSREITIPCWVQDKRLTECEQELLDNHQVFRIDVHWDKCTIACCGMLEIIDGVLLSRPQDGQR